MPQGESFWNPYRMVPVRSQVVRKKPVTEERFSGQSGVITCSLKNLTSLFVGRGSDSSLLSLTFIKRNGRFAIPGSSLKGMLRSVAELVGGGCLVSNSSGKGDRYPNLDDSYKACGNNRSLCITCRMFGMMGRGRGARVHKGKISIGDALITDDDVRTLSFEVLLMNHGTRHNAFYETPTTGKFDLLSRKMYFHQPRMKEEIPSIPETIRTLMKNDIQTIRAIAPGHEFKFDVSFSNLEPDELQLLVYTLALEEDTKVNLEDGQCPLRGPLRHKIGMAKPLGLGSCQISIERLSILPPPKTRFASLKSLESTVYEGESLARELAKLTEPLAGDTSPTMQHLRKIMIWDERDSRNFRYPDWHWFKTPGNASIKLKRI